MDNELNKIQDMIRNRDDNEKLNKIVDMLRHVHNDIEIVKKEIFLARHRMVGTGYALHDIILGNEISEEQIDDIINLSPDAITEADRGYTAIDEKDKEEWERIQMENGNEDEIENETIEETEKELERELDMLEERKREIHKRLGY